MNPQTTQRSPEPSPQTPDLPPGSAVPPSSIVTPGSETPEYTSPVQHQPTLTQTIVSMEDNLPGTPAASGVANGQSADHPVIGYNSMNVKTANRRKSNPIFIGLAVAAVVLVLGIVLFVIL